MCSVGLDFAEELRGRGTPPDSRPRSIRQLLPEGRDQASGEQLFERVRADFEELRGLKLTLAQARRLFGLGRVSAGLEYRCS